MNQENTMSRPSGRSVIEFQKFYIPFIWVFVPCFAYAFLRYTVFHNEPWYDLPFYLMNKVLGVTAVMLMAAAYVLGPAANLWPKFKQYLAHRKYLGLGGFMLGSAHGFMSLLLMNPNNYSVFFNATNGRLNWQGSLSMFFGTLALVHLGFLACISFPPVMKIMDGRQWKALQRGGIWALWITFAHIAAFGYKSWFNLEKWYGGMPPFSMIGASSILLLLCLRYALSFYGLRVKARQFTPSTKQRLIEKTV